jgi:hypothetical protein
MGTRHWPEDADEAVEKLEEKLDIELKRVNALIRLRESYEKELEFYRKQHYTLSKERLDKLEESLISEKEMNQILTNENSELEATNERLQSLINKAVQRLKKSNLNLVGFYTTIMYNELLIKEIEAENE